MRMKYISQRLPSSIVAQQPQEQRIYWQTCRRFYPFQPIYRVTGRLMAIELLTAVDHPSAPDQRLSPEAYFAALDSTQRLHIIKEQLELLLRRDRFFQGTALVASVTIDGPTLPSSGSTRR